MELPITFESDGKQIVGILHLPKRKNPPIIIMCHGWGANKLGTWSGLFIKTARVFCENGFAVLRFDFIGSGDSEGNFEKQNITTELRDLENTINHITRLGKINTNKIGLIGHSEGGKVALIYAAKNRKIGCLVSWFSPTQISDNWAPSFVDELFKRNYLIIDDHKMTKKRVQEDLKYDLIKIIGKIKSPTLIVGSEGDKNIASSQAVKIHKELKTSKKLIIMEDADHFFSGDESKQEITRITLKWFKKWLK